MRKFLSLCIKSFVLICAISSHAYAEKNLDIGMANLYMQEVKYLLENKTTNADVLSTALDKVEELHDQAETCVENANQRLEDIAELEKDNGIIGQPNNTADVLYIQGKKQLQAYKLSQCRLLVFKARDLILDLKEQIDDDREHDMLAVSEPMWRVLYDKNRSSNDFLNLAIVSLVTVAIIWLLLLIQILKLIRKFSTLWPKQIFSIYRISLAVTAIVIISLELIGYRQLAVYLSQGVLLTVGLIIIFALIVYAGNSNFVQEKILKNISITKKHKIVELKLLKFSLYLLIAAWFILLLLEWWGLSVSSIENIKSTLLNGETIYGIKIIPMRLLIGIITFSIIQIVGKYMAVYVSKQNKFDGEKETQVVIGSLITYIVFSIALVCGLLVSGVDFTGLAIIAGALSVGIGLGLQNIVNNFVSGLILLIEKPIKPGDRIMIKGTEGFVKKISIRSTRIVTLLKEDVIIPNSDLISNPITNYVFHDTLYRLVCRVGAAYDSDVEKVIEVLLSVAAKHDRVLNDKQNAPSVNLKEFGDSNLIFELSFVVNDVNEKGAIASEINLMIIRAFREHGITMSNPQIDVHMLA